MSFDPTAFGTFRYGYNPGSCAWKGANRSGGYAAVTGISAISGSAASNDLTKAGNRNYPVIGCVGGQHIAPWRVGSNQQVAAYKVAGTSFDTSGATGICIGGVISSPRGFATQGSTTARFLSSHNSTHICELALADGMIPNFIFRNTGGSGDNSLGYLPASATPFIIRINSGGWRAKVGDYTTAFTGTQTGGNLTNLFYFMSDPSQGSQWTGGIFTYNCWDGDTTSMSNTVMDNIFTAMRGEYPVQTPTTFIACLGHSWQAGMWGHGDDSVAGLIAEAFPAARVYNFAEGGALASRLTTQITKAITAAGACGFTPTLKIAHIMIGENELEAIDAGTFATDILAAKNALLADGFKVIFDDVHPFSHVAEANATVVAREAIRTTLRANLASINGGGALCMTYTNQAPWYVNYTGASTDALKATAVRNITDSRLYEISVLDGNDPTALTDSQELHPGSLGIRQLATQAIGGISAAVTEYSLTANGRFGRFERFRPPA